MKIITGGIGLLTLVAMTGCQRTSAPAMAASITSTMVMAPDSASASHKLQPGDCLLVTFHRKSLPQPITERVIVDAAGNITLPLAGKMQVSGLTVEESVIVIRDGYQTPSYGDKITVKVSWCSGTTSQTVWPHR